MEYYVKSLALSHCPIEVTLFITAILWRGIYFLFDLRHPAGKDAAGCFYSDKILEHWEWLAAIFI